MKEARELLHKMRARYEGHRHDEFLRRKTLNEILEILEIIMDQAEATAQATADMNTLLAALGTGLGDLLDEIKKLQALLPDPTKAEDAVKATEALDQQIKDATTKVETADATTHPPEPPVKTEAEAPVGEGDTAS